VPIVNAPFVANTVSQGRNPQRRHGIQKTGSEPTQTTVAQSRQVFGGGVDHHSQISKNILYDCLQIP